MSREQYYPTTSELKKIEKWEISTVEKLYGLLHYLKERWQYADVGYYKLTGRCVLKLRLSTAGWSGNESLIGALQKNFIFWMVCWQKSERGGHYWFSINLKTYFKNG